MLLLLGKTFEFILLIKLLFKLGTEWFIKGNLGKNGKL